MRIALGLQYDGSAYSGWQKQPNLSTVQSCLEEAINSFIGSKESNLSPVRVTTAGRTDAGVHALGQVVHFDVEVDRDDWSWVRGVNSFLPKDIVVNWAKIVSSEFHARFSAFERSYLYALHAGPCRAPLVTSRAGYLMMPSNKWLDISAMENAAKCLIGQHDFSSFRSTECQSKTPVKTLYELGIFTSQPWLYFKVRGNAFLHHMVRNLVGSLLVVGQGRQPPEWMSSVLAAKNRNMAAPTFSPDGLYLTKVAYPEAFGIPDPWLENSLFPKQLFHEK